MEKKANISDFFSTQVELASVLTGGAITTAAKVKAHRIWHGLQKPNDDEIDILLKHNEKLDANFFYNLTKKPPSTKN